MEELINKVNDRMQLNKKQIKKIIRTGDIKSIFKPDVPDIVLKIITAECDYHCGAIIIPELNIKTNVKCYVPKFIIANNNLNICDKPLSRGEFWMQFDKYLL